MNNLNMRSGFYEKSKSYVKSNIIDIILKDACIEYETEYKFCKDRKWRFDYFLPNYNIGIEVEGGTWVGGAHVRGKKYAKDCEKYNKALCLGFGVLRYTTDMLREDPGQVMKNICEAAAFDLDYYLNELNKKVDKK